MSSWRGRGSADLPESEHEPAEVGDLAEDILSRSEYDEPGKSIMDRITEPISDFLEWIFEGLGAPIGGGTAGWLAWVVLLVLVGGAVAFVAWAIANGVFTGRRGGGRYGDDAVVLTEEDRSSADWMAVAKEHEAGGRWREGVLCRYRALVVDLSDRGLISDVAGRTAGEYVRDMTALLEVASSYPEGAPTREAADSFAQATELFEEVWYGGAEAGPAERDRFAALAAATLAATETSRRGGASRSRPVGVGADGATAS